MRKWVKRFFRSRFRLSLKRFLIAFGQPRSLARRWHGSGIQSPACCKRAFVESPSVPCGERLAPDCLNQNRKTDGDDPSAFRHCFPALKWEPMETKLIAHPLCAREFAAATS